MEPIISIKNLGKKYNIIHQRGKYIALRDVLANIFRSPFKFAVQKTKQIIGTSAKEEFWALKDINFDVNKGEVVGIIGHNGAGKSTLLKILSQITPPTTGEITIRGTIGSLLEVGTGFHPELTGRENIMLNGAILGMSRKEIGKKFDAIVEFAGIEKFLDTPVKYYSSGMYVRLAFSVAAHMEPDILIIDEVLAVGDAEFQKKCLGKMSEITKSEGRTILFVSHSMAAIENLCQKCVVLKNGQIDYIGGVEEGINRYMSNLVRNKKEIFADADIKQFGPANFSRFFDVETLNDHNQFLDVFKIGEPIKFKFDFELKSDIDDLEIGFIIKNYMGTSLTTSIGEWEGLPKKIKAGRHQIICRVDNLYCFPGAYGLTPWIKRKGEGVDQQIDYAIQFNIVSNDITGYNPDFERYPNMGIYHKSNWQIIN